MIHMGLLNIIRRMHLRQKLSIREIARRTGLSRNIVTKHLAADRYHYDSHDHLRTHLADFLAAYNFACRLKTLSGLTPYEYICKIWTSEPDRFIVDPIYQMPGLNT